MFEAKLKSTKVEFAKVRVDCKQKFVRMLLLCGLLLFAFIPTSPVAQSVFEHPVQEDAFPPTLQALGAGWQNQRTIRTQFTQTKKISILRQPLVTEGKLLFSPEHGVHWQPIAPFSAEVVITPEGYFQRKNGKMVSQIPASVGSGAQQYLKAMLLVFSVRSYRLLLPAGPLGAHVDQGHPRRPAHGALTDIYFVMLSESLFHSKPL